jgi:putative transposase
VVHIHTDSSLFQLIDRKSFDQLVKTHGMDKGVRSLSTWEMTCALITSLTLRLSSYREVEETLGIPKSTLGDAMNGRFHGFFQDLCDRVLAEIRGRTADRRIRRGIRELLAIDSTECRVHGSLFHLPAWQLKQAQGQQALAGCKLHVVYRVDGEWIEDFKITGVRKHDSPVSFQLRIDSGKTYVFDRAYSDMRFWLKILKAGSHFVSRLRECAYAKQLQTRVLKEKLGQNGVLHDGLYWPGFTQSQKSWQVLELAQLRHILYWDAETGKVFHFITSDLKAPAETIARIYKRRWAVELIFRWLKGHLDIRRLACKNPKAVKVQLAIAVLMQLLLQLKRIATRFNGTPWQLLRKIRACIYRQTLAAHGPPDGCRWSHAPGSPKRTSCP